jgi:hypothetical protein
MSTPSWGSPTPQQPYGLPAPPKKSRAKGCLGIGCGGLFAVVVIVGVIVAVSGGKAVVSSTSAGPPAAAATGGQSASARTVTYVVTGSDADVQYGAAGSSAQGKVPMTVTSSLGSPAYYSISAQLNGSGSVTCKIEVDGKVISQADASGGYNIATCEIVQDPFSDKWQDANAG